MCGICLIAGAELRPDESAIRRMTAALAHRGPDACGVRSLPGCQLGHARLSIIDLSTGAQPMSDPASRYHITFNGEIYNYQELRAELIARGRSFVTHSDTEVVIAAFDEWGKSCVDRFRGMFSFAIWDTKERRVFAARDLIGEKPFYFAVTDGTLVVASELGALLASELVRPRLDRVSVDAFLEFGYLPPDRTIYSNVHTLPPGHVLEWSGGDPHLERYWRPDFQTREIGLDDASARLRELLEQAVRRQMVADVPVGAFLSGGHDSSTIVALMQKQTTHPVKTFSVGFGTLIDELPYARAVAQLYQTEHHEIDLGAPDVGPLLETMVGVYDEPFRDPSHIPTYLMSKYASEHVKVVLTGDGADEIFGGYAWYPLMARSVELTPDRLRWLVLRIVSKMLGDRVRNLARDGRAIGLALREREPWIRYVNEMTVAAERRQRWWGASLPEGRGYVPGDYYRPAAGTTGMNEVLFFDLVSFLPGDILVKVDRAAMAHGLETRPPFLDRDLVTFALSLPSSLKVTGDETKVLFKHALREYWPESVRARGKQGFAGPFRQWMDRADVQALLARVLADGSPLRELLPGLTPDQRHVRDYATWNLLTLGLWLERCPAHD